MVAPHFGRPAFRRPRPGKALWTKTRRKESRMARIEESIDVGVPISVAYNQWTQFEEFPQFMEGIESVQQIDDTHLLWTGEIGGAREEWRAEISEQRPDERVA